MSRALHVLVADDESLIRDLFSEAVRESRLPLRLSTTDNGRDCLTLLNGGNVDVAFIDVHMPELSGMEAIWVARRHGIGTFITLISGAASPEVFKLAQKLDAYEFLVKPFTIEDVLTILNNYTRIAAPMKVLIVDDSSTTRSVVQKVIQQSMFSCETVEAANAAAAILHCRQQPFDTVLLDCNMPHVDGLTALHQLRAIQPALKVIMISAERDAHKEREAREAGAHGFLYKPFYADHVDRMLHAVHRLRLPTLDTRARDGRFGSRSVPPLGGRPRITDAVSQVIV
jgi:DNA-binding NtrC family response regulator